MRIVKVRHGLNGTIEKTIKGDLNTFNKLIAGSTEYWNSIYLYNNSSVVRFAYNINKGLLQNGYGKTELKQTKWVVSGS